MGVGIREKLIGFINTKKRKEFFSRITSDFAYKIVEQKKHYEMIFQDGSITKLPKKLFSFSKRFISGDTAGLKIGKATYLQNLKLDVLWNQSVEIGSYCSFGPNVVIKPDGVRGKMQFTTYPLFLIDPLSMIQTKQVDEARNFFVSIGNDCFIGENSKIMANVTVGNGVIIGERSLVTSGKILEPFGIYAGQPAKLIGYRYDPEIITELMRIQWWNWPLEKIINSGLQHIDLVTEKERALTLLREL